MIKKYFCIVFLILNLLSISSQANESDFDYENFISESLEYAKTEYETDISDTNLFENIKNLINSSKDKIFNNLKRIIYSFSAILLICILSSVLKACVLSEAVGEIALFGCYITCAFVFAYEFKNIAQTGLNAIADLCDYMNVSFPGYASVLASAGYGTAANSMHVIFVTASNILAFLLNKFIIPIIYSCAILSLSNGICNIEEIDNMVKFIVKMLKYTIGILLSVFSAIMGFTGLSASLGDGIIIKTAKYAISNFIPVVGVCLADTLNNVIYTSLLIKNAAGIVGISVILTICFTPIIRLFCVSIIMKLLSYFVSMLQHLKLGKMIETISEIISFIGSMLLFITVVFILLLGIIVSIGV